MERITSIHQPSFFPWLGLLDKIAKSNHFVFLDSVQVNKGSHQYRNTFFCNGMPKYLTLPVEYSLGTPINRLEFKNNLWVEDHLNKYKNYYHKSYFFEEIYPIIDQFYRQSADLKPVEVIINSMLLMFNLLNIKVETSYASVLNSAEKKGGLVLDLCKHTDTKAYLSGKGALNYMDEHVLASFRMAGIQVIWHNFVHPVYEQSIGANFVEGLSSLDLLFFNGIEKSRNIFRNNINQGSNV